MTELAGVMVGNYFLLECLVRQGMVEKYRARPTTRGGYDIILRLFRPEFPDPTAFREHFAVEVEKVWRCHHPHILPLFEFGTGDDLLYCATLWPEAETLEQFLLRQQGRPLPIAWVLRFASQLCSTVQYAHEHDIVHGNIQPSSIFLRNEEELLLTDFGMRRAYQEGDPLIAQLDEGNPTYIAPEQALGMVRPTSDIYAIGVLLYRLLGGALPYNGDSAGDIALKHTNDPIPSLRSLRSEVPDALDAVIQVALSKNAETRFPSANALAQALLTSLAPESAQTVFANPRRRIHVQARRTSFTWTRAISLLTLGVLLLGLVGTSLLVFSLPQRFFNIHGHPFWDGQIGRAVTALQPPIPTLHIPSSSSNGGKNKPTSQGPGSGQSGLSESGAHAPISGSPVPGGTAPGSASPPTVCVSGSLSIDGSSNAEPLLQQVANDYQSACANISISLAASGNRPGIKLLRQGQIDMASCDVTVKAAQNLTDHPAIALLYAVIVSADIPVKTLSTASLQGIYQGQITNWSEVGGPNEAIQIVQRPGYDPVRALFNAYVLGGQAEHVQGIHVNKVTPDPVINKVSQTPGAIGYVPLLAVQDSNVRVVAIDGVAPSISALAQGQYPFWSIEHLYTQGDGTQQFSAYIDFLTTKETNQMASLGGVPANVLPQNVVQAHLPGPEI